MIVFYVSWELDLFVQERKYFLLAVSYFFYATLDLKFLPILILSPLFNFGVGLLIGDLQDQKIKKGLLAFGVGANLFLLATFKYYDFFLENILNMAGSLGFHYAGTKPYLNLILPLGISFFTFQGISYLVDIYRGQLKSKNSLLDVLLFISFFPHLVAGPIVKAAEFIPQLGKAVDRKNIPFVYASTLIVFGLFKKVVIANYLGAELVDPVFESPSSFGAYDSWLAVYGYAVQIYCDFSAYSDMAIGFAALLGYEFPVNFNQPYRAQSLQDFWRRWHISLSSWLRDYLFISLGGSREGEKKTYRNLMITMLLGGLWHGAHWNFILWGAMHGGGLAVERAYRKTPTLRWSQKILWTLFTFHFVCLAWIFFRASSFELATQLITQLFDFSIRSQYTNAFFPILIVIGMSLHFLPPLHKLHLPSWFSRLPQPAFLLLLGVCISLVAMLAPEGVPAFIYFRF